MRTLNEINYYRDVYKTEAAGILLQLSDLTTETFQADHGYSLEQINYVINGIIAAQKWAQGNEYYEIFRIINNG